MNVSRPQTDCENDVRRPTLSSSSLPSQSTQISPPSTPIKKSLIESASPQLPIFFTKGNFSHRRRILKGRRIVSAPLPPQTTATQNTFTEDGQHHYYHSYHSNMNSRTNKAVRRVQMVSKRAALASKRKVSMC